MDPAHGVGHRAGRGVGHEVGLLLVEPLLLDQPFPILLSVTDSWRVGSQSLAGMGKHGRIRLA